MSISISAANLYKIFSRYPVRFIPLIQTSEIMGYISKDRVKRFYNNDNVTNVNLARHLEDIFVHLDIDDFLNEISGLELKNIKTLPVIDGKSFEISDIGLDEFVEIFRPVRTFTEHDLFKIMNLHPLPFMVFNSEREIIYQNNAVKKLHELFSRSIDENYEQITDYFPEQFYEMMKKSDGAVKAMKYGEDTYQFRMFPVNLGNGSVTSVLFYNAV